MATIFVFDTSSLRVFGNYYPETFPSFWQEIGNLVGAGRLLSVREVLKELDKQSPSEHLNDWAAKNSHLFSPPSVEEMSFVAEIFRIPHFQQLIGQKQRLIGAPVADPFLIARGRAADGCVVTEEAVNPNAAKIPNVCQHFGIRCVNVKGFLSEVEWSF